MTDAVGQKLYVGAMVAHIIFGNRYTYGGLSLAKVVGLEGNANVKIFKLGGGRASVVSNNKVLVIKKNCKLSNVIVSDDGKLARVQSRIHYVRN